MNEQAETLIRVFPNITTGEWLEALAIRELDRYTSPINGNTYYPAIRRTLVCVHCGEPKGSTVRGLKSHHTKYHKDHGFSSKQCMERAK